MQARAFAFWLQGHFEINDSQEGLTIQQMGVIRQKLTAIKVTPADGDIGIFVGYMRGTLDTLQVLPLVAQQEASPAVTTAIKQRLNNVFLHAIDPTIAGDQQQNRRTHRPGGDDKPGGGIVAMC